MKLPICTWRHPPQWNNSQLHRAAAYPHPTPEVATLSYCWAYNLTEEEQCIYLAGMHIDEVGGLLSHCESVKSILWINQVILSTLLDPEKDFQWCNSLVNTRKTKTKTVCVPDVLLAFIVISPVLAFVLSCVDATATSWRKNRGLDH